MTLIFLVSLGGFSVLLGRVVLNEMDSITSITTDAASKLVTRNLAQGQVDFLRLKETVRSAEDGGDLDELRAKFDLYYSRIKTFQNSPKLEELRTNSEIVDLLVRVRSRLDRLVPLIEGADEGLRKALPELSRIILENEFDAQTLVEQGVLIETRTRTNTKQRLSQTLQLLGGVLIVLVVALGLAGLITARQFRRGQILSAANKAAAARMRTMVTSSLDAILMLDKRGRILSFNGAAEDVFGYSRTEALGQSMVDLIVPDYLRRFCIENVANFLATGEGQLVDRGLLQMEGRKKSGKIFPVELSMSSSQAGSDLVFVCFMRDITDRVESEEALRRARDDALAGERAKANLLTVMSHEIRTPLNGILGSIELLETTGMLAEEKRYLQAMRISAELLLHHVNEVLELSRLEAGGEAEQIRSFDLQDLVAGLVDGQQAAASARGNKLYLQCRLDDQPIVMGRAEGLQQALLNLVGNALKFTQNGDVVVEVERLGDETGRVEFRVCDTGQGISQTNLDRVFEEFVTLDSSYSRKREGTGLGLAITRRLIEKMGGEISVESELGEGSLFRFAVPLPAAFKRVPTHVTDRPVSVAPKRLLVVEDNDINRMLLEKMLQRQGHQVESAVGGAEGVEAVTNNNYDLVFMDISMPGMDGIQALKKIRKFELAEDTTIIALTAHAAADDCDRILQAGFAEVLTKPVTQAKLAEAIERHTSEMKPKLSDMETSDIQQFVAALGEERAQGYLTTFCQDVAQLQKALDDSGTVDEEQQSEAHRLAGSAAVLGLAALRSCMLEIEAATPQTELPLGALELAWSEAGVLLAPHLAGKSA
ncbi:response regulator [Parasedimentitalea maritima]|uniref:histidine kinase n=1 Tax=Parasedimentitalea maritima TaxID=2578117 RepID=A0ABY2UUT6_9RHOB|nr:PAS domain-containing hybrid sensor histidine kinase/response regulator [Zongyanglinia marina]TLP64453.1 response regulator [Zongyanglinia marina]